MQRLMSLTCVTELLQSGKRSWGSGISALGMKGKIARHGCPCISVTTGTRQFVLPWVLHPFNCLSILRHLYIASALNIQDLLYQIALLVIANRRLQFLFFFF